MNYEFEDQTDQIKKIMKEVNKLYKFIVRFKFFFGF